MRIGRCLYGLVAVLLLLISFFAQLSRRTSRAWQRRRVAATRQRALDVACDRREQRLEDANVCLQIGALHTLLRRAAVSAPPTCLAEIQSLLDRYVANAIARAGYVTLLRQARVSAIHVRRGRAERAGRVHAAAVLARRTQLCNSLQERVWALDNTLDELEGLIKLECERALYRSATHS